jgi:hypothetical protein
LASTPGIGVKLDKLFVPVSVLLEPLAPLVSTWVEKDKDQVAFSVDQQDVFTCVLTTFDGYQYILGQESFVIEFRHRLRFQPQSAGPPVAELLSKPAPYSELLEASEVRLLEMLRLSTAGQSRRLLRIGVISTTVVAEDEAPPGVTRFLKYAAKPWDATPEAFNLNLTVALPKSKETVSGDRCIHSFTKAEDGDGLITIRLDWQRQFDGDKKLSMSTLPDLLKTAKKDAMSYFEDVGEGARFDD